MRNRINIVWAFVLISTPVFADDFSSLKSVVEVALKHAPSLQAAQASRDASAEDVTLGRAQLLPYVVANGSLTRRNQDFTYDRPSAFLSPTVRNNEQVYGIRVYQPLFDLEKWASFKQGGISATTGNLRLAMERQQTILQVAAAWLDVMRAQASFEAAKASELAMQRLAMQAKASFEVGTAAVNESLAASSRRDLAMSARIHASQILMQAEAQLNSLLGRVTSVSIDLHRGIEPLQAKPDELKVWEQRAEENALEVQLSNQAVAMADAGKMQAVGAALPKLQLVAGWNRNKSSDGSFGGSTTKAASIGIELTVPLYAGGATWAQQRKTTKEKVQADFNMAEAKRISRLAARQSLLGLRTTAAELRALSTALTSAETARRAAQVGFEVGLRTITEALDAEERLAGTRQRYADAVARHAMAFLKLSASSGDLDESSVETVDVFLF